MINCANVPDFSSANVYKLGHSLNVSTVLGASFVSFYYLF